MKKIILKSNNGITLIALVITIIVLLILAGVSIAMLTGENGILTQAQRAKEETENAQTDEANILNSYEDYLSQVTNGGFIESKGVNAPVLKNGMELVTYNEETGKWDTNNSSSSYDYIEGEGTEDNNSSKWANAKVTIDGVDSYFVWIPRYAYKITYNNPEDITQGGTIDVKFLIGTTDQYYDDNGDLQIAKRATTGDEDTTNDYYVHPAFTNNVDLGGWKNELTGIWIGKYESSLVNKVDQSNIVTNDEETGNILLSENTDKAIAIQPGISSWRCCTIGNMYTNARGYAEALNSHMLKNSEWGAIAYLTYSQYGRNGKEVTINNSSQFITGSAGNSMDAETDIGTTNDYTSSQGVLASSTGNVYGIYDLSGGAGEYVAVYYNKGTNSILKNNGEQLVNENNKAFVTIYSGMIASDDFKLGDATYEVNNWNNDTANFFNLDHPFFGHGGSYDREASAGIFNRYGSSGIADSKISFRICLTI